MRYRSYEVVTPKRVLTYCLYVVIVAWFFVTAVLGYQFLMENSQTTTKKGGTFVEAIFNEVSYLPYLKNDGQSMFYQSFLFDACVHYSTQDAQDLKSDFCSISTEDRQTYYVGLTGEEKKRSDGKTLGIEDLLFTYDSILAKNSWGLKSLAPYKDVQVSLEGDGRLKIVFPTSSTDNNYFFSYYILPKHVLANVDLEKYKTIFASNPITSSCGKIAPRTSDPQSLVFDLTKCEQTNFAYYQIKNYHGIELLSKAVNEDQSSLVDTYANQLTLPGYQRLNVVKNQFLTLFFNTKSPKMKVRFRRAFGGLINANLYKGDYRNYFKKYTDPLFSVFQSDGSNIKEFLNRLNQAEDGDNASVTDLWDSGVASLPKSLSINGVERKFIFHTAKPANNIINLEVKFSNQFENIKVSDTNKNTYTPKNYKKTDKKIVYPLEVGKNLRDGLNQYTIQGSIKGKTYTIAYIDLYLLGGEMQQNATTGAANPLDSKVKIVYYNNLESNFVIKHIREILTQYQVLDYFLFEQISTVEELEGKLIKGEYDILISPINIGMKKDILKIVTTDDPLVNPSKYTNPNLTQLFKQYTKAVDKSEFTAQINHIVGTDMPFVILGYPYDFIHLKSGLIGTGNISTGTELYEFNWRDYLFQNTVLMQSRIIDFSKLKDWHGFLGSVGNVSSLGSGFFDLFQEAPSLPVENEVQSGAKAVEIIDPSDPFGGLIQDAK